MRFIGYLRGNRHSFFILSAFSWFSFFEYWIAAANMAFHATVILDFPNEDIVVGNVGVSSVIRKPVKDK